ncbi:MAG TPA: pitrilysin family protein [Chitinophagaceae bacterium]|nr:pitrilysin family protein [Chitinophagaceae bacterium]
MELLTIDRKIAPPIVDAVNFHLELKPYEKNTLDNGVPVYAINAGAEEVLLVEMVFFSGNSFEEKNLVAAATNFLLRNGTSKKKALEINEHFEYYGSFMNRACYNETATLTLHCLNKHISELLPVVEELITDSIFPEEELAIFKQNQKQRLSVSLKKPEFVAGRLIDSYLYGEKHPYGKYTTHEEYDALNREELISFHNKYYRNGNCIIFTAGKLPAGLFELLNKHFGKLPLGNNFQKPLHPVSSTKKPGEKFRVINDVNGVQGSIRIAREFPNRHHPDFQKVMVLNNILGGYFGSRLMSNIREDKGYTYGIHSYLQDHIQQSAWLVSTEAGKDVCEAAIHEIYKEMKRLQDEPVSEEELQLVRNYMMGSILGDLDGPFHIIARWKNYILNNLDETYFYSAMNTIRTVSAGELQQLAKKYLNPEAFYELVVQ